MCRPRTSVLGRWRVTRRPQPQPRVSGRPHPKHLELCSSCVSRIEVFHMQPHQKRLRSPRLALWCVLSWDWLGALPFLFKAASKPHSCSSTSFAFCHCNVPCIHLRQQREEQEPFPICPRILQWSSCSVDPADVRFRSAPKRTILAAFGGWKSARSQGGIYPPLPCLVPKRF